MATVHVTKLKSARRPEGSTAADIRSLGTIVLDTASTSTTAAGAIGQQVGLLEIHASAQVYMAAQSGGVAPEAGVSDRVIPAGTLVYFHLGEHDGTFRLDFHA